MTYPPTPAPRPALHSRPAAAARSSAPRNPAYAPREWVTKVPPLRGVQLIFAEASLGRPGGGL